MNPESSTPPTDVAADGTAFVAELSPDGTALLYSTYLGGSGNGSGGGEFGEGIAVDAATPANVYVTGDTFSPDFPVSTNAFIGQPGTAGTANGGSAFVTKLNPSLTGAAQLIYSTYLGGDTFDDGHGIAIDAASPPNIYVTGVTESTNFPSANPLPFSANANGTRFSDGDQSRRLHRASFTGVLHLSGWQRCGIFSALRRITRADVVCWHRQRGVPSRAPPPPLIFQRTAHRLTACLHHRRSRSLRKLMSLRRLVTYSTCLGGTTEDLGNAIALGTGNLVYLTGQTFSADFPTVPAGSTIPAPAGSPNVNDSVAFVSVINPSTGALTYSTFLGGNNGDCRKCDRSGFLR